MNEKEITIKRVEEGLNKTFATSPQAEVLIRSRIPQSAIHEIMFFCEEDVSQYIDFIPINVKISCLGKPYLWPETEWKHYNELRKGK